MIISHNTYRVIAEAVDRATNPDAIYPNMTPEYIWVRDNLEPLVKRNSEAAQITCKTNPPLGERGAIEVIMISPRGERTSVFGKALHVAREIEGDTHFTIHEVSRGNALVAIVPSDHILVLKLPEE